MKTDTLQVLANYGVLLQSLNSAISSSDLSATSKVKMQTELLYEYSRTVIQGLQELRGNSAMYQPPDVCWRAKLLP